MIDRSQVLVAYAWCAAAILLLQVSLRLGACETIGGCTWSLAKGMIWSAAWPAWLVATEFPVKGLILINTVLVLLIFLGGVAGRFGQGRGADRPASDLPIGRDGLAAFPDFKAAHLVTRTSEVLGRTKKYWLLPVVATAILVVMALTAG